MIGNLFEIELESTSVCAEAPEEPQVVQKEQVLRLSCHIDNNNQPINSLTEGLKISLEGQVEKMSPLLGRNAIYNKTARINKLVSPQLSDSAAILPLHPVRALLLETVVRDQRD